MIDRISSSPYHSARHGLPTSPGQPLEAIFAKEGTRRGIRVNDVRTRTSLEATSVRLDRFVVSPPSRSARNFRLDSAGFRRRDELIEHAL